jgi:hypothetical protein
MLCVVTVCLDVAPHLAVGALTRVESLQTALTDGWLSVYFALPASRRDRGAGRGGKPMASDAALDLSGRDRLIVQLIARFKQASSRQVHELLFPNVTYTPADRALKRLTDRRYLTRIERRTVGGSRGGSGQYVYGLGRRGFYLHYDGRFILPRMVNYHALAVLDTFIVLRRLELAGRLRVAGLSVEDEAWVKVGGDDLRPDMYADMILADGRHMKVNFEIDMATEGQKAIRDKLQRYWRIYYDADHTAWQGEWPG